MENEYATYNDNATYDDVRSEVPQISCVPTNIANVPNQVNQPIQNAKKCHIAPMRFCKFAALFLGLSIGIFSSGMVIHLFFTSRPNIADIARMQELLQNRIEQFEALNHNLSIFHNNLEGKYIHLDGNYHGLSHPLSALGTLLNPAESCLHLKESGVNTSNIYTIKPRKFSLPFLVYCDMNEVGGGWTLVARIHENNIKGKCTLGDKWSSESGASDAGAIEDNNWQNTNSFGFPYSSTSSDYKSPAYFASNSSNIMIWHVPNNIEVAEFSERAVLKYYTDNNFLQLTGGCLKSLYENYKLTQYSPDLDATNTTTLRANLKFISPSLVNIIPNFYAYNYDDNNSNLIKDGGGDMYDSGNKIYFQAGSGSFVRLSYGDMTTHAEYDTFTDITHPFHAFVRIRNDKRSIESFSLKVISNFGADGEGYTIFYDGKLSENRLQASYHVYQVYGAHDPSICEVFYIIYDSNDHMHVSPSSFIRENWINSTVSTSSGVRATGSPKHVLLGYTLLSKTSGSLVYSYEVVSVLRNILQAINRDGLQYDNDDGIISLSVPVRYIKGNNERMMATIPTSMKTSVEPGFIEFTKPNIHNYVFAMCPGIRTTMDRPEAVCIGGINTMETGVGSQYCGDFANWDGDSTSSGFAKNSSDINSSILIFVR